MGYPNELYRNQRPLGISQLFVWDVPNQLDFLQSSFGVSHMDSSVLSSLWLSQMNSAAAAATDTATATTAAAAAAAAPPPIRS